MKFVKLLLTNDCKLYFGNGYHCRDSKYIGYCYSRGFNNYVRFKNDKHIIKTNVHIDYINSGGVTLTFEI